MSSFTPGPWRISASCLRDECYVGISSNKHTDFAEVVWRMIDEDRSPQCEANAHLIAAAPDLLEALQDLLRLVEDNWLQGPEWDADEWMAFDRYRDVIAKAQATNS